jgi:hypothetical protein
MLIILEDTLSLKMLFSSNKQKIFLRGFQVNKKCFTQFLLDERIKKSEEHQLQKEIFEHNRDLDFQKFEFEKEKFLMEQKDREKSAKINIIIKALDQNKSAEEIKNILELLKDTYKNIRHIGFSTFFCIFSRNCP